MVGCWLNPDDAMDIRQIAVSRGMTLQALVEEAMMRIIAEAGAAPRPRQSVMTPQEFADELTKLIATAADDGVDFEAIAEELESIAQVARDTVS